LEDERLARPLVRDRPNLSSVREPVTAYGRAAIRAAVRLWWCAGDYGAIVELGERLDQRLFDEEPLVRVYIEAAKAQLAGPATAEAHSQWKRDNGPSPVPP
jgi:hypothetical protein